MNLYDNLRVEEDVDTNTNTKILEMALKASRLAREIAEAEASLRRLRAEFESVVDMLAKGVVPPKVLADGEERVLYQDLYKGLVLEFHGRRGLYGRVSNGQEVKVYNFFEYMTYPIHVEVLGSGVHDFVKIEDLYFPPLG